MKYMVEYSIRTAGLTADQAMSNSDSLTAAFANWEPEAGLTVHAFVSNLNNGGYILVEADDADVVLLFVSKFFFWNDVNVVPVVDVDSAVSAGATSLEWARANSAG
jgi:hypothetical protein